LPQLYGVKRGDALGEVTNNEDAILY
jgi:hypothetical protein